MDFSILKSLADKVSFLSGIKINSDNTQINLHVHLPDKGEIPKEQLIEATKILQGVITQEKKILW